MSPKAKKAHVVVSTRNDEATRDFIMARLAAARQSAAATTDAIDEAIGLFMDPDEDDDGEERVELIGTALEAAGCTARALEAAEFEAKAGDNGEWASLPEPWDEDDEEEDEEETD